MQYTTLGRTGLQVSVAGLGCGGNSRIGLGSGLTEAESVDLVRAALARGITFFDTAESYGTEHILGAAFAPSERERLVISTKSRYQRGDAFLTGDEIAANLHASLARLKTDYVDVFLLHGLAPAHYDRAIAVYLPVLLREQERGRIRHIGLSETAPRDPEQTMLRRAAGEPAWGVFMLAFHMLNQGARHHLLPDTRAKGIGTLAMFVVRNIFSRPGLLAETCRALSAAGHLDPKLATEDPLAFLVHAGGADSLTDAAYRYARHQPGIDVVLFGTSNRAHLDQNVDSILRPPLPAADVEQLNRLFGHLKGVGLDLPDRAAARTS